MNKLKINHLAVLICTVFMLVLGFLWYGPLLGGPWMEMVNIDMETIEKNPPGAAVWITTMISAAAHIYMLAWLFTQMNVTTGVKGLLIALAITTAFILLNHMGANMFALRPYPLAWITAGFYFVGLGVSGFILGSWKKFADA